MILPINYTKEDLFPIDLSINNPYWDTHDVSDVTTFEDYLEQQRNQTGKYVAYGGYCEQRALYRRSKRFQEGNVRDTHLGVDYWLPVDTPVVAVLDGVIHSYQDNDDTGNYGPTIILEHEYQGKPLYSLYGHLSRASLEHIKQLEGTTIPAGTTIGWLGNADVNGGYAPHLHFQLMYDMQGFTGDYPGVCDASELEIYLANCVDPNLLYSNN